MPEPNSIGDAERILGNRALIAEEMVSGFSQRAMEMGRPYQMDTPRLEKLAEYDVSYLSYALSTGEPELYTGYVGWLHSMLAAHGLPGEYIVPMALDNLLRAVEACVELEAPEAVEQLVALGKAVSSGKAAHPETFFKADNPLLGAAREYLGYLVKSDRRAALDVVRGALGKGVSVQDIYLNIFEPVQQEIGRLWQMHEISVAHEHFASVTTQTAMSLLYDNIFDDNSARHGRSMVAACVGDELHEIGLRMVADLFEMSGWDTIFLGANAPVHAIAAMLKESNADLLALSCSMIVHVENIRATIAYLRRAGFGALPVMVGGFPFNISPKLAGIVGADGCAADAGAAVAEGRRLCG